MLCASPCRSKLATLLLIGVLTAGGGISSAATCQAKRPEAFPDFFARFSAEKAFAIDRTVYPLSVLRWEYGADAQGRDVSEVVRTRAPKDDADEGYNQLGKHMAENGLESKIKEQTTRSVSVSVYKPDTDWLTTYKFKRQGMCWYFYEIENHSL